VEADEIRREAKRRDKMLAQKKHDAPAKRHIGL
jgi:hypothetical protein